MSKSSIRNDRVSAEDEGNRTTGIAMFPLRAAIKTIVVSQSTKNPPGMLAKLAALADDKRCGATVRVVA